MRVSDRTDKEGAQLTMLTVRNFIVGSLAAIAVVAGIVAFAGLNLGGGGGVK